MFEAVGFMFFSTIETLSLFALMMSLYRLKMIDYIWPALFVILLMNLQSYVLRNELSLEYLVPLIGILIFTFMLATIVKLPIVWSAIVTISGYVVFGVIQTIVVTILFGSVAEAQSTNENGYILQTVTALLMFFLSWGMYKFGIGFSFNFDRFRIKWENIITVTLIMIFLIAISVILYFNQIWINILFFGVSLAFLLYYAVRKENEE